MTAATLADVHASALPCTANPDLFQIVGANSLVGRARIVAALNHCHRCPIEAACLADVRRWPELPRGTVVGGVYFDHRRRMRHTPPPLTPHARSEFAPVAARTDARNHPTEENS